MSPLLPVCLIVLAGVSAGGGLLFYIHSTRWASIVSWAVSWASALLFVLGAIQCFKQLIGD